VDENEAELTRGGVKNAAVFEEFAFELFEFVDEEGASDSIGGTNPF
jgi:hypothetical protein